MAFDNSSYHNRHRRKKRLIRLFEILTILFAALLLWCAYAGDIDPRKFVAAPFMALAFVPMLALALVWLLLALIKRRWLAAAVVVLALLFSAPIIKLFVPMNTVQNAPPMPADPKVTLTVMTYNVLAFNYNDPEQGNQPCESMKLILEANPDVVLLQEGTAAGLSWEEIPSLAAYKLEIENRYPYRYSSPEGLGIMSKIPFETEALGEPQQARSPIGYNRNNTSYLARAYDLNLETGKQLRLIDFRLQSYHLSFGKSMNVRVSPDVKLSPLERMRRSFALRSDNAAEVRKAIDNSPANVIVCGDMNDVTASHVYRAICGNDLRDAWSEVGFGYAHTYNRHNLYYRIDHILYRGSLRALAGERIKGGSSDHYPLMVTFDLDVQMPDKK